jgi:hypothetical protein
VAVPTPNPRPRLAALAVPTREQVAALMAYPADHFARGMKGPSLVAMDLVGGAKAPNLVAMDLASRVNGREPVAKGLACEM